LTGVNDCRYRISAMYRNQWSSIPAPYNTPSISFDINSLAPKVIKTGTLSAGLLIYNDRSGDGHLNNLSIIASGGYAIHPDIDNKLAMRYVLHGGDDIDINDKSGIVPSIMYMGQAGASQINLGGAYRYALQGSFEAKLYF